MSERGLTQAGAEPRDSRRGGVGVGFDRMAAFEELCVRSWRRQLLERAMRDEGRGTREEAG